MCLTTTIQWFLAMEVVLRKLITNPLFSLPQIFCLSVLSARFYWQIVHRGQPPETHSRERKDGELNWRITQRLFSICSYFITKHMSLMLKMLMIFRFDFHLLGWCFLHCRSVMKGNWLLYQKSCHILNISFDFFFFKIIILSHWNLARVRINLYRIIFLQKNWKEGLKT